MVFRPDAPSKRVPLFCPFCGSEVVTLVDVGDDLKTIKVQCPSCREEAILAVPPIRSMRS